MRKLSPDIYFVTQSELGEGLYAKDSVEVNRIQFYHIKDCRPDHEEAINNKESSITEVFFDEQVGVIVNHTAYINERPKDISKPYLALDANVIGPTLNVQNILTKPSLTPPTKTEMEQLVREHNCVRVVESVFGYQTTALPHGDVQHAVIIYKLIEKDDLIPNVVGDDELVMVRETGYDNNAEPILCTFGLMHSRKIFDENVANLRTAMANENGRMAFLEPSEIAEIAEIVDEEMFEQLPPNPVMIIRASTRPLDHSQIMRLNLQVTQANSSYTPC